MRVDDTFGRATAARCEHDCECVAGRDGFGDRIDGRSDLYSLGCILYELIGGRTPFRSTTPMAVLMAHVHQEAPALGSNASAGRNVPPGLDAIVMQLLAKTPDGRFATATALREALEAELQRLENPSATMHAPQHAIAPEVNIAFNSTLALEVPREGASTPTAAIALEHEEDLAPPPKSRVGLAVVASVLVLATLAAAVLLVVTTRQSTSGEAAAVEPAPLVQTPPAVAEPDPAVARAEAERAKEDRKKAEEQRKREEEQLRKAEEKQRKAEEKARKRREKQRKREQKRRSQVEPAKPAEPESVTAAEKPVAEKPVAEKPAEPQKKPENETDSSDEPNKNPRDKVVGEVKDRLDKGAKGLSKILEDKMDDLIKD